MKLSSYQAIKLKAKDGLTLVEMVVVLAIVVTISVVGFAAFGGYRSKSNMDLTTNELVEVIRTAQKRSITEQDGKTWGIRFTNSTSTSHSYEIFSGPSYVSGTVDKVYNMRRSIFFNNPGDGLTIDAVFSAISGKLPNPQIISLNARRKDGLVKDVLMQSRGTITTKLESGVIGYWHFDEGTSTNAYDASGMGNSGSLISSPTWQSGSSCKAGGCLNFDGTSNYITMGNQSVFNLTNNATVMAWVKIHSAWSGSTYPNLVSKGASAGWDTDGWSLIVFTPVSDNRIGVGHRNGANSTSVTFTNTIKDQWTHIVGTWDGNLIKIYQNGVLKNSATQTFSPPNTSTSFIIGRGPTAYYFDGEVDEVRIYNRALSATEILNIYNDLK